MRDYDVYIASVTAPDDRRPFTYVYARRAAVAREVGWEEAYKQAEHVANIDPDIDLEELLGEYIVLVETGSQSLESVLPDERSLRRASEELRKQGYFLSELEPRGWRAAP